MSDQVDWENEPTQPSQTEQKLSQLALWSLILGILSPVCCGCLTGIPAVITGHLALSAVGDERGELKGRGFAIAGLVLGYISIVLTILAILIQLATGGFDEIMRELDRGF